MQIFQVPGVFFGYPHQGDHGRRGAHPVAIVHHTMQGWMPYYLEIITGQTATENTAHFSIGQNGMIRQHVALADAAWCNGLDWTKGGPTQHHSDPTLKWLVEAFNLKLSPNEYTISIELEGKSGVPLTAEQYASLVELDRVLIGAYRIPLDRAHLVGHYQIDGINKLNCPGAAFPWLRLMEDLKVAVTADQIKEWTGKVETANNEMLAKIKQLEEIFGPSPFFQRMEALRAIIHDNGVAYPRHEVGLP